MTKNYLEEGEIRKLVKHYEPESQYYNYRPKDFISYQINGEWRITFTYLDNAGYELHIKREGIRCFSTLTAVGNCLRRMGITEFKAIL